MTTRVVFTLYFPTLPRAQLSQLSTPTTFPSTISTLSVNIQPTPNTFCVLWSTPRLSSSQLKAQGSNCLVPLSTSWSKFEVIKPIVHSVSFSSSFPETLKGSCAPSFLPPTHSWFLFLPLLQAADFFALLCHNPQTSLVLNFKHGIYFLCQEHLEHLLTSSDHHQTRRSPRNRPRSYHPPLQKQHVWCRCHRVGRVPRRAPSSSLWELISGWRFEEC